MRGGSSTQVRFLMFVLSFDEVAGIFSTTLLVGGGFDLDFDFGLKAVRPCFPMSKKSKCRLHMCIHFCVYTYTHTFISMCLYVYVYIRIERTETKWSVVTPGLNVLGARSPCMHACTCVRAHRR